jgi:hypothetical protein
MLTDAYSRHWGAHPDLSDASSKGFLEFIQINYHTGDVFGKNDLMISTRGQTNWGNASFSEMVLLEHWPLIVFRMMY